MTDRRNVDDLVASFVELAQALARHRDGQIAGGDDVTAARTNLRDKLRAAFGLKERAEA